MNSGADFTLGQGRSVTGQRPPRCLLAERPNHLAAPNLRGHRLIRGRCSLPDLLGDDEHWARGRPQEVEITAVTCGKVGQQSRWPRTPLPYAVRVTASPDDSSVGVGVWSALVLRVSIPHAYRIVRAGRDDEPGCTTAPSCALAGGAAHGIRHLLVGELGHESGRNGTALTDD